MGNKISHETENNAKVSNDEMYPRRGWIWSVAGGRNSPENKEMENNASSSRVCRELITLPKAKFISITESKLKRQFKDVSGIHAGLEINNPLRRSNRRNVGGRNAVKNKATEKIASSGESSDELYPPVMYPVENPFKRSRRDDLQPEKPKPHTATQPTVSGPKSTDIGGNNAVEKEAIENIATREKILRRAIKNASHGRSSDEVYPRMDKKWKDVGGRNSPENKEMKENPFFDMIEVSRNFPIISLADEFTSASVSGPKSTDIGGNNAVEKKAIQNISSREKRLRRAIKNASHGRSSDEVYPRMDKKWKDVGGRNSPENKEMKENPFFDMIEVSRNFPIISLADEFTSASVSGPKSTDIGGNNAVEKKAIQNMASREKRLRRLMSPTMFMRFEIPADLRKWHNQEVMKHTSLGCLDHAVLECNHKLLEMENKHDNLRIATVLNILASILGDQRRYREAFEHLNRARKIIKNDFRLGESHPCMAFTFDNLAVVCEKLFTKMENDISKPYKLCDLEREKRKGVVATSLEDLLSKIPDKLDFPQDNTSITIVLESDGTEVDDEEYFATLEPDTSLMALRGPERWCPNVPRCHISLDQTDDVGMEDKGQVASLVGRLQHNLCHISLLGGQDLELLSDMDPDSLADIVSEKDNKIFLEQLKEASGRILLEKRQAHDAMELLKLYHQSVSNGTDELSAAKQERV